MRLDRLVSSFLCTLVAILIYFTDCAPPLAPFIFLGPAFLFALVFVVVDMTAFVEDDDDF